MKEPMLTPVYLTLMYAFKQHADYVLDREKERDFRLNPISLMQEYCTLRLDAGRQTGKTEAVAEFCKDWLSDGNDVIVMSTKYSSSAEMSKRIKRAYDNVFRISKVADRKIIPMTIRDYLSGSDKIRGLSLNRVLVIIDEPMFKMPEMYKFYKAYEDSVRICTLTSEVKELPLFFVMGIQ